MVWTNPSALRLLRSEPTLKGLAVVHGLYHLAHHSLTAVFVLNVSPAYQAYAGPNWYGFDDEAVYEFVKAVHANKKDLAAGHPSAPDFVEFYRDPFVLFEDELPNLYR